MIGVIDLVKNWESIGLRTNKKSAYLVRLFSIILILFHSSIKCLCVMWSSKVRQIRGNVLANSLSPLLPAKRKAVALHYWLDSDLTHRRLHPLRQNLSPTRTSSLTWPHKSFSRNFFLPQTFSLTTLLHHNGLRGLTTRDRLLSTC